MNAEEELTEDLDAARYTRPALPPGVREYDGLPVRFVERLPESTVRDAVAWTFAADVLPSS